MRDYKENDEVYVWRNSPEKTKSWHIHKVGETCILGQAEKWTNGKIWLKNESSIVLKSDIRPVYWVVKWTDDPRWKSLIDYLNKEKGDKYSGVHRNRFYGKRKYSDGKRGNWSSENISWSSENISSFPDSIELSLDEWIDFNYDGLGDEFILPSKWTIKVTLNNWKKIDEYRKSINAFTTSCQDHEYVTFEPASTDGWVRNRLENRYTLVTDEQFNKHVWNNVAVNKEQLSSPENNSFLKGEELVITGGISIHGIETGTRVIFQCYASDRRYDKLEDSIVSLKKETSRVRTKDLARPNSFVGRLITNDKSNKTNNMKKTVLTRKQLLELHKELNCGTCKDIIQVYLTELGILADDSTTATIRYEHLERIPELSIKQREVLAKYIALPFADSIQEAINKVGSSVSTRPIKHNDRLVMVPLPNANKDWTFEVFDYVKKFCDKYPNSYPVHGTEIEGLSNMFMYIQFYA